MTQITVFYLLSAIVLFFHSFLNFYLCGVFADKTRFHKVSIWILCAINAIFAPQLFTIHYFEQILPYILCIVVLAVEFNLLYIGNFSAKLGVVLGSVLHLFVLRAILMASFSIANDVSMYAVLKNEELFPWVNFGSFAAQIVTLSLFILWVPAKTVKEIMTNKIFYDKLLLLTALLTAFMAYNSYTFTIDYFSVNLALQEIVIAVLVLAFFYIMILQLINFFNLRVYKKKTKELETKIDRDKTLTATVLQYADIILELNCASDTIQRLIVGSKEMPIGHLPSLSEFMKGQMDIYTHPDDIARLSEVNSLALISEYAEGVMEKDYEYRSKKIIPSGKETGVVASSDKYLWYRMRINIRKDEKTPDIIAFLTIEEIHDEKEEVLALRYKADSDHLTGALNKQSFTTKVSQALLSGAQGTLYMFDLDNFKGINDNMGHSQGDAVLREVYGKISTLFRSHDVIGRIGGDEFVVFLEGSADQGIIEDKALNICKEIKKTYKADNKIEITISCSIGIARAPQDGRDFKSLFDAADVAMYTSKSKGKDTYTVYDKSLISGFAPQDRESYMRKNRKENNK